MASGEHVFAPEWRFDSACVFGEAARPEEIQLLFEPMSGAGHAQLWLRQSPATRSPIDSPPQLDRFSGHDGFTQSEFTSLSGLHIDVASHRHRYGPHDAIWRTDGPTAEAPASRRGERDGPKSAGDDAGAVPDDNGSYVYLLQVSAAVKHDVRHLANLLTKLLAERVTSR
jgi:hypothetical protein